MVPIIVTVYRILFLYSLAYAQDSPAIFVHHPWTAEEGVSDELVEFAASATSQPAKVFTKSAYVKSGWASEGGELRKLPRFAGIVAGHIRTGRFDVVTQNVVDAIFAPLETLDLFIVCETGQATDDTLGQLVRSWGPHVRQWHLRDATGVPRARGCSGSEVSHSPCWPYLPQHFKLAAGLAMLVDVERASPSTDDTTLFSRYEWVLRMRSDVTYVHSLPPAAWWIDARAAVYVDWIWHPRRSDGSVVASVKASDCKSVRDVFAVVHRDFANSYFSNFVAAYIEAGRCVPEWGCPPCNAVFHHPSKPLGLVPPDNPDPILGSVLSVDARLYVNNTDDEGNQTATRLVAAWRKAPVIALYLRTSIIVCGDSRFPEHGGVNVSSNSGEYVFKLLRQHDPNCDAPFQGHPNLENAKNLLDKKLPVTNMRNMVKIGIENMDFGDLWM